MHTKWVFRDTGPTAEQSDQLLAELSEPIVTDVGVDKHPNGYGEPPPTKPAKKLKVQIGTDKDVPHVMKPEDLEDEIPIMDAQDFVSPFEIMNVADELTKRGVTRTASGKIVDKDTGEEIGMKFDEGKLRFDLIPAHAIMGLVNIITHGAAKYGPENWKKVTPPKQRYFASTMRHLSKWFWLGERIDSDSGRPHLWHVICNVAFLIQLEQEAIDKGDDFT